jgi:predicted RNase H-like nuclease (RuvC/YqgF family)
MTDPAGELRAALETERGLREQIADLVHARARAADEAQRLAERARLPAADASLAEIGARYERQAEVLGSEIEQLRAALRETEARVERLRAEAAGA